MLQARDAVEPLVVAPAKTSDRACVAVGTRFSPRRPYRTVRAAFPHTACMGVSLSRVHHAIFVVLVWEFLCQGCITPFFVWEFLCQGCITPFLSCLYGSFFVKGASRH